jgi:sugar/nucleoside kinase (ribokinase family)
VRYGILDERLKLRPGTATPFSDCFNSRESGRRTHLYFAGVADEITPDDFDFWRLNARILHLGLPGAHAGLDGPSGEDPTGWVTILKRARAAGLKTNLEMVSTGKEKVAAFGRTSAPHLDYLIVNDYEIGCVAGMETRLDGGASAPLVAEALLKTLAYGPLELVVAHFPAGAIAATRGGGLVAQGSVAIPNEAIAGVNGAGDAFAAGVLYGVHEGYSVEASLRLGHAVAAASMREVSTTQGVAPVAECLSLAERHGFRPAPA